MRVTDFLNIEIAEDEILAHCEFEFESYFYIVNFFLPLDRCICDSVKLLLTTVCGVCAVVRHIFRVDTCCQGLTEVITVTNTKQLGWLH